MLEDQGEVRAAGGKRPLVWVLVGGGALLACVLCLLIVVGGVAVASGSARVQGLLEKWGLGFSARQLGVAAETPAAEIPATAEMPAEGAGGEAQPTSTPQPTPTATSPATSLHDTDLPVLLERGMIVVESVDSSGMGILGTDIITVNLYNPTDKDVLVTIPPGYFFAPPAGSDEQRMMVLQAEPVTVPAGGYASVSPYVTCIDADLAAPSEGSAYQLGSMVDNERLREFALCVAQQELPTLDFSSFDEEVFTRYMSLQFAVWSVAEGQNFAQLLAEAGAESGGAAGSMGEMGDLSTWLEGTQTWLDLCNVQFDE